LGKIKDERKTNNNKRNNRSKLIQKIGKERPTEERKNVKMEEERTT
jgi:hypothetical protein